MGEGFVVQYLCEVGPDGFVCESENVESGPQGPLAGDNIENFGSRRNYDYAPKAIPKHI